MHVLVSGVPVQGIRSSGAGVTCGCELPDGMLRAELGLSGRAARALLSAICFPALLFVLY